MCQRVYRIQEARGNKDRGHATRPSIKLKSQHFIPQLPFVPHSPTQPIPPTNRYSKCGCHPHKCLTDTVDVAVCGPCLSERIGEHFEGLVGNNAFTKQNITSVYSTYYSSFYKKENLTVLQQLPFCSSLKFSQFTFTVFSHV